MRNMAEPRDSGAARFGGGAETTRAHCSHRRQLNLKTTKLTKAIFFLLFASNIAPATARFGLNWPGTPVEPESPTPTKMIYNPPIDYGENDGVTPEIESLLRKYAPVIYLQ
jgi:hypothetical protein